MATILIVGVGPLGTDPRAASGPQFRTTLFWQALRSGGHVIHLASLADADSTEQALDEHGRMAGFPARAMMDVQPVESWARALKPDAIIGCGTILPAATAARLRHLAPVWVDLAGDPIAEVQSKAQAYPGEPYETLLHHVWKLTQTALRGADRLSGVSRAQCHAMMGQLALLGRLNRETADQPMIFRLPNGPQPRISAFAESASVFRGVECPPDAFLVAWSGSYNTWVDIDLLYAGLVAAMEHVPSLHYVSTGGGAAGYNEGLYEQFCRRVEGCPHRERFHMLGWLDRDKAESIHRECDLGLNIDRWCHEGILGARNRIVAFLDLGVPVATTPLAEISTDLIAADGAIEIPFADPQGMAAVIAALVQDRQRLKTSLDNGRQYLARNTFLASSQPLLQWAQSPARSGDFGTRNVVFERTDHEMLETLLSERHMAAQGSLGQRLRRLRERLR